MAVRKYERRTTQDIVRITGGDIAELMGALADIADLEGTRWETDGDAIILVGAPLIQEVG